MKSNTQNLAHLCLVVLVLGAAFALASCGSSEQSASQENVQSSSSGSANAAEAVHAVPAEATLPEPTASATGLPPDVMATLVDTSAAPGETVEIEATGTHDVVEVQVKSDRGEPFNLALDADRQVWRGVYRVPLGIGADRIALSVTARNDLNKWRRVWLFVHVAEPAAESTATQEDPAENN
jgi:hypothetical protein